MLKFSKKTDYAIILLAHLGMVEVPVSASEVASYYQLPPSMIANILKQLSTAGIMRSTRGQNGGYTLQKTPQEITLAEIISIMDGPFHLVECVHLEKGCKCKIATICPTQGPLRALHERIQRLIESVTLAKILEDPKFNSLRKVEKSV